MSTPKHLTLHPSALTKLNLLPRAELVPPQYRRFFMGRPGYAPYWLLAYLSTQFVQTTLVEIGVHNGWGSLALSYNPLNLVVGYDVDLSTLSPEIAALPNVRFREGIAHTLSPDLILSSPLIHFDAAHDGVYEQTFLDFLIAGGYQGMVLWDDIHRVTETEGDAMPRFWRGITVGGKYDLTAIGHETGSGLLCFGGQGIVLEGTS